MITVMLGVMDGGGGGDGDFSGVVRKVLVREVVAESV